MRRMILVLAVLLAGCGSRFLTDPPEPPPFEDCAVLHRTFSVTTPWTPPPTPVPFAGGREGTAVFDRPVGWGTFDGQLHVVEVSSADADWVTSAEVYVGDVRIIQLAGGEWKTASGFDVRPYVTEHSVNKLQVRARIRGSVLKPPGRQTAYIQIVARACGPGSQSLYFRDTP